MNADPRRGFYEKPEAYFALEGNAIMKLSPAAAIEVCNLALINGFVAVRIEGGLCSMEGGRVMFEPRVNCIWDAYDPSVKTSETIKNTNADAAQFVREESLSGVHNCFIITMLPVDQYLAI